MIGGYSFGSEDGNPCAYRFRRHIHGSSPACEYGCSFEIDTLDQRSAYRLVEGVVPTQILAAKEHPIPKRNIAAMRTMSAESEARAARKTARGIIRRAIDLGRRKARIRRAKVACVLSTTTLDVPRFRTQPIVSITDCNHAIRRIIKQADSSKQRKGYTSD